MRYFFRPYRESIDGASKSYHVLIKSEQRNCCSS